MAFLRSNIVNLLNLHFAIHALALSGGGSFFAAFLLKAGVPIPVVLASLALILAGRFLIRPFVLVLARRWGLKPLVIAGTIISGLQYPLLAEVHGLSWHLLLLCLTSPIGDTLYWTSYHAYFASLGDAEHRGHQIGAREAIAAIVGVVGPLATGWTLAMFGPRVAFDVTAMVLILAALPLLATPNVAVARDVAPARPINLGVLLMAADSWSWTGYGLVWQIALFVSLGQSFTAFGGAVALAALVGAVSGLLIGRWIDFGHGSRVVLVAAGAVILTIAFRAASYGNPALAVIANAVGAFATALYTPTVMTVVYNQAQQSPCPLRFHIGTEAGWDVGGAVSCLIAAALIWAGAPLAVGILLSLAGTATSALLLRRHYLSAAAA